MGQVLCIVYRCIAMHLVKKAGFSCKTAQTGAVTLIQRFGSALNLNIHFHLLFCAEQQSPSAGDTGKAGQGQPCQGIR